MFGKNKNIAIDIATNLGRRRDPEGQGGSGKWKKVRGLVEIRFHYPKEDNRECIRQQKEHEKKENTRGGEK